MRRFFISAFGFERTPLFICGRLARLRCCGPSGKPKRGLLPQPGRARAGAGYDGRGEAPLGAKAPRGSGGMRAAFGRRLSGACLGRALPGPAAEGRKRRKTWRLGP